ncbi:hypothetical protein [Veillonella intestinalis]|uniref:hypothetical protein n=1 Tax=Veillonella intestinalis TaxID=2941341 RepID=UPI003FCCF86E
MDVFINFNPLCAHKHKTEYVASLKKDLGHFNPLCAHKHKTGWFLCRFKSYENFNPLCAHKHKTLPFEEILDIAKTSIRFALISTRQGLRALQIKAIKLQSALRS